MSCLALMALAVTLAAPQAAPPARKHVAPIIPRDVLFGNPDRTRVRISPDGTHLGYLAARDGVLNVFVQDVKDGKLTGEPKAVTKSTSRPIRDWSFVPGASQVLYLRDEGGNENFQLFAVDLASGEPLVNSFLSEGQEVGVIGVKRCPQFGGAAGIEALGPRHWGFDLPYRPIEERVAAR